MTRVLLASNADWSSTARLPGMLARAGIECDLIDIGGTIASSSRHVRSCIALADDDDAIARDVVSRCEGYDRVLLCNESLIRSVMRVSGGVSVLPAPVGSCRALLDKTAFPTAAAAAGLSVARSEVACSADEVEGAASRLGGHVVVKGRYGEGGVCVRLCATPLEARKAAEALGFPVLVESRVTGRLIMLPCLYERSRLVAAMACRKVALQKPNGPSAVNEFFPLGEELLVLAKRIGEAFGLHGFASADVFLTAEENIVLEVNVRQVAQLRIGRTIGVDFGRAVADVLAGRWDGEPRVVTGSRTVRLFPQDLYRYQLRWGSGTGALRWGAHPAAWLDLPWDDAGVLRAEVAAIRERSRRFAKARQR